MVIKHIVKKDVMNFRKSNIFLSAQKRIKKKVRDGFKKKNH